MPINLRGKQPIQHRRHSGSVPATWHSIHRDRSPRADGFHAGLRALRIQRPAAGLLHGQLESGSIWRLYWFNAVVALGLLAQNPAAGGGSAARQAETLSAYVGLSARLRLVQKTTAYQ